MSNKNNVNPDHYKVAGRDRPGEDILHEQNKQQYSQAKAGSGAGAPNLIPGAAPVGVTEKSAETDENEEQETRQADEAGKSNRD
ncbi:MAG TPA: hypothetical protein VFD58_16460 [Blastocatellia bacterium]|nr:hypothetical protein [Blastocatellia bacterium]